MTKMRMKYSELKKLLTEAFSLSEQLKEASSERDLDASKGSESIDAQLDRFFIAHEKTATEAAASGKKKVESRQRSIRQSRLLKEAKDEAKENEDTTAGAGRSLDDINVEQFASDIARLVDNFDSLIETRQVILRRAINFLAKSYDKDVVALLKTVLARDYDLEVNKTKLEADEDRFPAPRSGLAGPYGDG
jgi:hypothetical protein